MSATYVTVWRVLCMQRCGAVLPGVYVVLASDGMRVRDLLQIAYVVESPTGAWVRTHASVRTHMSKVTPLLCALFAVSYLLIVWKRLSVSREIEKTIFFFSYCLITVFFFFLGVLPCSY